MILLTSEHVEALLECGAACDCDQRCWQIAPVTLRRVMPDAPGAVEKFAAIECIACDQPVSFGMVAAAPKLGRA